MQGVNTNTFILIGGMPRSGTNLIRRIIGSHSEIAIPPAEFQFFRRFSQGKTIQQILANSRLKEWQIDFSDLYDRPPQEVFIAVLKRYADRLGKHIPGEKSPCNEFYIDIVEEWLTGFNLKFIIMVRNPFDMIASYKHIPSSAKQKLNDKNLAFNSAQNWSRSVSLALARFHHAPEHYYVLRYEDLIDNPVNYTKDICTFIGIDFEEERMLTFADFAEHKDNTSFTEDHRELSEQHRVYKPDSRKKYLVGKEEQIIASICGELAWGLGYQDKQFALARSNVQKVTLLPGLRPRRWTRFLNVFSP